MINKFKSLSGIHGLNEFVWQGDDLKKFSLLYGWNGTGKTTLSNVLYCLNQHSLCIEDFEKVQFKLEVSPSGTVDESQVSTSTMNLAVYNEEFINSNVHFNDSGAEPIVMIGDANIKLLEEITSDQETLDEKTANLLLLQNEQKKSPDTEAMLSDAARNWRKIATELSVTGDTYYGNVFKINQVRALIVGKEVTEDNLDSLMIEPEDEAERRQAVKADWEAISAGETEKLDLADIFKKSNELLATIVKVSKLDDVESLSDILKSWVEEGVSLHKDGDLCAFCRNPLAKERLEKLQQQFTDSLTSANVEIDNLIEQIGQINLAGVSIDSSKLMPGLRKNFTKYKTQIEDSTKIVSTSMRQLSGDLREKKKHLTDEAKLFDQRICPNEAIKKINDAEEKIVGVIGEHNTKVENIVAENSQNLKTLMLSCVAAHIKTTAYFTKLQANKTLSGSIDSLEAEIKTETAALDIKKDKLNDQRRAVEKINGLLSNFFENDKLCFQSIEVDGLITYQIMRRGRVAKNLSQGEKSVVALAYFLVSILGGGGSKLSDTTVVIDDPVDSQDSNFLFRTYGVTKRCLKDAKQVIILTHSYEFFNIIRDWFNVAGDDSSLLLIEREVKDSKEKMIVSNLPTLLRDYKTEYHYLFSNLFGYVYQSKNIEAPMVANIARKVLEYFSSFKWCCRSSEEFAQRIQGRFMHDSAAPEERAIGDAVYKFVNEYSHALDPFRPIGITDPEALSIAQNTLNFIKEADQDHFNALKKQCNRESS